jgi:hypothetical protein
MNTMADLVKAGPTESSERRHRRVVMTTCQAHAAAGFTNLLVTKEDGVIVLNPHIANCCVLRLDEQAATALLDILAEWLG